MPWSSARRSNPGDATAPVPRTDASAAARRSGGTRPIWRSSGRGSARPNRRRNGTGDLAAFNLRQRDELAVFQNAEVCSLPALVPQPAQECHGRSHEIAPLHIGCASSEGLAPHMPLAAQRVETDETRLLHGGKQTVRGGHRKACGTRKITQALALIGRAQPRQQIQRA